MIIDDFLGQLKALAENSLGMHRVQARQKLLTNPNSFEVRGYDKQGKYREFAWMTDANDPSLPEPEQWITVV